uniref:Uncharacterized protein n=1 Tax=Ananas comosus var. bracteatus TaxID=296719 RepID=A0A6V7NEP0_ANACO|nr:unnamed protein product [Ananas comosus var. bracteatus]
MQSLRRLVLLSLLLFLVLLSAPKSAWALEATILDPVDYLALQAIPKSLFDMPGGAFFQSWTSPPTPARASAGCSARGPRGRAGPRRPARGLPGALRPPAARPLRPLRAVLPLPRPRPRLRPHPARPPPPPLAPLPRPLLQPPLGPPPRSFSPALRTLDLSSNRLSGPLPAPLLRLPFLSTLVLARNALSSSLPAALSPLVHLDLRSNRLSGPLPESLLPPTLRFLDLSANRFSGRVPGAVFTLPLASLRLQRNRFSGALRPDGPAPDGATVDLSYNRLTGRVPAELATAGTIYLNSNRFTGDVPAALVARVTAGAVRLLYLQHNYLTGFALAPNSSVPPGTSLCLHDNCMVPPAAAATSCPVRAGRRKTRPPAECAGNTSSYQR